MSEVRSIEYFLDAVYPITIYPAPEGGYVAEIEDLPGCITEGETSEEAVKRIEEARRAWIEVQYEAGEEIPLPRTKNPYSGKFIVRLPKRLHQRLAEQANKEGVSLNQYVETMLAEKTATKDMIARLITELKQPQLTEVETLYKLGGGYSFSKEPPILPQKRFVGVFA